MVSDEERREVAERLRVYSHDFDFSDSDPFWYVSKAAFGDVDVHTYCSVFARLADLIDRPTCKLIENDQHRYLPCSRCGAFIRWDAVTNLTGVVPTRYCPNCGADVVE